MFLTFCASFPLYKADLNYRSWIILSCNIIHFTIHSYLFKHLHIFVSVYKRFV